MSDRDPDHSTGTPSPEDPGAVAAAAESLISPEQVSRVRSLIEILQAEVPPAFRQEVFRQLLPAALLGSAAVSAAARPTPPPPAESGALVIGASHLDLSRYAVLLAGPGRTLVKALAALDAAQEQLGIDWMSPSEIERFLTERARVRSVYRTNISNALRGARQMVDRRRRGRGYEYRITLPGKEALEREVTILGSG